MRPSSRCARTSRTRRRCSCRRAHRPSHQPRGHGSSQQDRAPGGGPSHPLLLRRALQVHCRLRRPPLQGGHEARDPVSIPSLLPRCPAAPEPFPLALATLCPYTQLCYTQLEDEVLVRDLMLALTLLVCVHAGSTASSISCGPDPSSSGPPDCNKVLNKLAGTFMYQIARPGFGFAGVSPLPLSLPHSVPPSLLSSCPHSLTHSLLPLLSHLRPSNPPTLQLAPSLSSRIFHSSFLTPNCLLFCTTCA
eukprot:2771691-Rhodomonas_salina.2